jgi:hypothetical protein
VQKGRLGLPNLALLLDSEVGHALEKAPALIWLDLVGILHWLHTGPGWSARAPPNTGQGNHLLEGKQGDRTCCKHTAVAPSEELSGHC